MDETPKNVPVKKRKIRKTDWQKVEEFLKKELEKRKSLSFRKSHEAIWKEVDRQIAMDPMKKYLADGKEAPVTWQSSFELGELSKASEVVTADVMRLVFPASRNWQEPHCKAPVKFDQASGKPIPVDPKKQKAVDGMLRSLMGQQQIDFGFKARVELSVKEALHHGGFVATAEWEKQNKIHDGVGVESLEAPVWVPHSMWNCFPDSSPSIIPGAIFYPGSMMITSYMPRHQVLALRGDGYMNIDPNKIPKRKNTNKGETEDVELVTYYGDLNIEREDGDIFLPNSKCITANGTIIYYRANPLPFPEVIYQGYERQDVRDPYFTSPIIKNSPLQKLTTILANKFIDGVDLWSQPPGTYDGNDPYLVQNGGPTIHPGAMTPSKGSNKVTFMTVGDPKVTLLGLQFGLTKMEEGTGVNAIRSGVSASDRKTATEVERTEQRGEVRTVDFVDKLELGALRPFLYMQHELNLKYLKDYSFYCSEKGLPDFLTFSAKDLPKVVHFEVVGSKGILGEMQRTQKVAAVTAWASQTPGFAELLNRQDILKDMYEDAGVKSAETYIIAKQQIPLEVQAQLQQAQEIIQELQAELQKSEAGNEAKMAELQLKAQQATAELRMEQKQAMAEQSAERRKVMLDAAFERWKAKLDAKTKIEVAQITAAAKPKEKASSAA